MTPPPPSPGSRPALAALAARLWPSPARRAATLTALVVTAATATLATTATSCATRLSPVGPAAFEAPAAGLVAEDWEREVAAATRRVEPFVYASRQADMRATLVTPRLRRAFAAARPRFSGRFARDLERDLLAFGSADEGVDAPMLSGPAGEQDVLVVVAIYVADQKHRDLASRATSWDIRLSRWGGTIDGAEAAVARVAPRQVTTLRLTPAVQEVFPHVDRYDDLYLLRFPAVDPANGAPLLWPGADVELEVTSALADCRVAWTLQP